MLSTRADKISLHSCIVQDAALWPMDEERGSRPTASGKADIGAWLNGERASFLGRSGDDSIEGLSPRGSLGVGGQTGSLPYLECLAAPAMEFGGPSDELQGGSPMQTSSTVLAGLGCTLSDAVSKGRAMQDTGTSSNGLQHHQSRNGLVNGIIGNDDCHSTASGVKQQQQQQQQDQPGRRDHNVKASRLDAAEQERAPSATAYRERPCAHPLEVAADARQHVSDRTSQQDAGPEGARAGSRSPVAAGLPSDIPAAMPSRDAPEQPPSTGTSPQHDRKRCRLRMDAACSSRQAGDAAGKSTSVNAAANGRAAGDSAATAQQPVRRSFELRLVPSTPDVRKPLPSYLGS